MERLGELAAFGTAICWTASALFFERASKRLGALTVNFYKVCGAFILLVLAGWAFRGQPLPLDAPPRSLLFLSLSGIVGFLIADYFLFNAYILVGSRLTVLFQPLTPLVAAFLAFAFLGERMRPSGLAGMGLVVAGILLVMVARNAPARDAPVSAGEARPARESRVARDPRVAKGIAFALASVLFQAVGTVLTKIGVADYDAIAGTQIRVTVAIVGFGLQALVMGQGRAVFVEAWRDRDAMKATAIGSVFGPFLGVTLSLAALKATSTGVASALISMTPVLIIPPSILFLKQKIRSLEIAGACAAVAGAALFFML